MGWSALYAVQKGDARLIKAKRSANVCYRETDDAIPKCSIWRSSPCPLRLTCGDFSYVLRAVLPTMVQSSECG